MHPIRIERIGKRPDHMFLSNQFRKPARTPFARENLIRHTAILPDHAFHPGYKTVDRAPGARVRCQHRDVLSADTAYREKQERFLVTFCRLAKSYPLAAGQRKLLI
jgi:hypothetical protein